MQHAQDQQGEQDDQNAEHTAALSAEDGRACRPAVIASLRVRYWWSTRTRPIAM